MKCLTVCQPYASLIFYGGKFVENRRWYTPYRGLLAIHAGKSRRYFDDPEDWRGEWIELRENLCFLPEQCPFGCVLGTAKLVACLSLDWWKEAGPCCPPEAAAYDRLIKAAMASAYAEGPYCWILADPRPFEATVPARGGMGLWDWEPAGESRGLFQ